MKFILKEGFEFFADAFQGKVPMEQWILAILSMIIMSVFSIRRSIRKRTNLLVGLILGLLAGMFVTFAVVVIFQAIHYIMSEHMGISIQPNDLETKRWYALVNALIIMLSPLVLLLKNKSPWKKFLLSLANIPFFLVVYWVVASLWKPEVQVGLEIQLVMIISLTIGLHILYALSVAKKKRKKKKKKKKKKTMSIFWWKKAEKEEEAAK